MALFGKKDLGLLLPDDTPGDPISLRHTKTKEATDEFAPLKPKIDASTKVTRYRAGQVPHFAVGYEEERGFVTASSQVRGTVKSPKAASAKLSGRKRIEAQVITKKSSAGPSSPSRRGSKPDRSHSEELGGKLSSDDEKTANALNDSSSEEEDEEAFNRRRQALRKKLLANEKQTSHDAEPSASGSAITADRQVSCKYCLYIGRMIMLNRNICLGTSAVVTTKKPAVTQQHADTESSAGSSGSEWETDTDESDAGEVLMKPVFVPKKARETIKRQEELEAEEEKRRLQEEEKMMARKQESRKLVAEEILREAEEKNSSGNTTDAEMPDDTDGVDPDQEYRDWELREMRRIKRDRDLREQCRKEAEETQRRREMTEEEREAEDRKLKKNQPEEKAKLKFMQKYYHKGVFYMDDASVRDKEDVRRREATGATLEDKFNKEMLPAVMQVKNFGRSGQTKYTHLADQDTTQKDSLWARKDTIRDSLKNKISGVRDIESSLSKRRKRD